MRIFYFTILNFSEKLVILRWKIVFSNFLYQYGDPNFKLFHVGKNIENTQFLTLGIHIFPITNLEKSLHHLDMPTDIKKLLHIIFQLSITHFSEQFKIVKKSSH